MERLPGFRDFYPEPVPHPDVWSADARQYIFDHWRATARNYAFREYDGPPLEPVELFTTKSGDEILGQLYNFTDKGDRPIALRPEMTPTLARMVAAHERSFKKPMKWFAIPQLFRYERQQKGRLREHFQFNADIVGEAGPAADAELIALLIDTLRSFGLTSSDFVVRISSRTAWHDFYQRHNGEAQRAYEFFQVIDKWERESPEHSQTRLAQLGITMEAVKRFIEEAQPTGELEPVLSNLTARGLVDFVQVDYQIVRGLAYYTGIVFEAFARHGDFRAIAGGGRYDNLIKLISGNRVDLPALGFGMGDVVLWELLKERNLVPKFDAAIEVFFLIEDETIRGESLHLIERFRDAQIAVEYSFTAAKSDKQFKRALECKARFTARLERNEQGLPVRVKNLADRIEKTLTADAAIEYILSQKKGI